MTQRKGFSFHKEDGEDDAPVPQKLLPVHVDVRDNGQDLMPIVVKMLKWVAYNLLKPLAIVLLLGGFCILFFTVLSQLIRMKMVGGEELVIIDNQYQNYTAMLQLPHCQYFLNTSQTDDFRMKHHGISVSIGAYHCNKAKEYTSVPIYEHYLQAFSNRYSICAADTCWPAFVDHLKTGLMWVFTALVAFNNIAPVLNYLRMFVGGGGMHQNGMV